MTVATKESPAAAAQPAARPPARRRHPASRNPYRRLWQVPLLLAGVAIFGLGVQALISTIKPVPFEKQIHNIQTLIDAHQYNQAIDAINSLCEYFTQPSEQATLQVLAGDALFFAERQKEEEGLIIRINYERAMEHYEKAVGFGYQPGIDVNERWGISALAVGNAKAAEEHLEAAIAAAGEHAGEMTERHGKNLVAAYLEAGMPAQALAMVEKLLKVVPKGPDADQDALSLRTWSLCKRIEIALATHSKDPGAIERVVSEAREQVDSLRQRDPKGRVLTWIGKAEFERGDRAGAEKDLTAARSLFAVHHQDDGRAAMMLGMIKLENGDAAGALKLFQEVIAGHAGTTLWPAARWGRAMATTRRDLPADALMIADYRLAIQLTKEGAEKAPVGRSPELLEQGGVRTSLVDGFRRAITAKRYVEALTFLGLEKDLGGRETSDLALRWASTRESRGNELLAEAHELEGDAAHTREAEARTMLTNAAEDYLRHSKMTTLTDEISGTSLWKAGELLDRAGQTLRSAEVYDGLTKMRPRDPRVAEGFLALGRLYESAGMFDKAIAAHELNIKQNPNAPAAYSSVVAVAQCYMTLADRAPTPAERDKAFAKAEGFLLALVQDNTDLQPSALEFRESLVTLGDLYYNWSTKIDQENAAKPLATPAASTAPATAPSPRQYPAARWSDAILRLDESLIRYGSDSRWEQSPRVRFMLAESYRKSAIEIATVLSRDPLMQQRAELQKARQDRLGLASQEFARLISVLDADILESAAGKRKLTPLESDYLRVAYMDRAECHLERGEYDEAVMLYDRTAARFSEELIAVQAYVQIVNAYLRQGKSSQAAAAAERGRWMLKRIPDTAFERKSSTGNRAYFEKLLTMGGMS